MIYTVWVSDESNDREKILKNMKFVFFWVLVSRVLDQFHLSSVIKKLENDSKPNVLIPVFTQAYRMDTCESFCTNRIFVSVEEFFLYFFKQVGLMKNQDFFENLKINAISTTEWVLVLKNVEYNLKTI